MTPKYLRVAESNIRKAYVRKHECHFLCMTIANHKNTKAWLYHWFHFQYQNVPKEILRSGADFSFQRKMCCFFVRVTLHQYRSRQVLAHYLVSPPCYIYLPGQKMFVLYGIGFALWPMEWPQDSRDVRIFGPFLEKLLAFSAKETNHL